MCTFSSVRVVHQLQRSHLTSFHSARCLLLHSPRLSHLPSRRTPRRCLSAAEWRRPFASVRESLSPPAFIFFILSLWHTLSTPAFLPHPSSSDLVPGTSRRLPFHFVTFCWFPPNSFPEQPQAFPAPFTRSERAPLVFPPNTEDTLLFRTHTFTPLGTCIWPTPWKHTRLLLITTYLSS